MKKWVKIILSIIFVVSLGTGLTLGLMKGPSFGTDKSSCTYLMAMDTVMSITVYGKSERIRKKALQAASDEIERLDGLLSVSSESGEVYKLNHGITISEPSDDLLYLLDEACRISDETSGAFDITVYPLMELWGFTSGEYGVPDSEDIKSCLNYVGMDGISTSPVSLAEGCAIDLGAIAKGYASERVADVLMANGISDALINLGGNIKVIGEPPSGDGFTVGIDDPFSDDILGTVTVKDRCVVTSGNYQRFFEKDGKRYHHILDPHTGYPADGGIASVTVICDDATTADALSTALFVMGYENALSYQRGHSDKFSMVIVADDGEVFSTESSWDPLARLSQ